MALNNKGKGTVLVGSVGAVAIILGLVMAGFYPSSESASPIPFQPEQGQTDNTGEDNSTIIISETNESTANEEEQEQDTTDNAGSSWLDITSSSLSDNNNDDDQEPVPEMITVSDEEGQGADAIIECSVPNRIKQGSSPVFSAILFDRNLHAMQGQTVVWNISPGNYSFTSVTQADGTTEVTPNLSKLARGQYDLSATAMDASCTDSFELTRNSGSSRSSSSSSDSDNDDIARPELRITTPTEGDVFTGPSSGGIPVFVTGTASDGGQLESVEVRWIAWYGLTGYRMATPGAPGDWSTWEYDQIKFNDEGVKTIFVKATDKNGNKSWKAVNFDVVFGTDNTRPSISIDAPEEDSVIAGPSEGGVTVKVTGTTSDVYTGVQIVEVRTDMATYEAATQTSGDWSTWEYDLTFTTSGAHQIVARVTDNAGNMQWVVTNVTVQLESDDNDDA